MVTERPRGRAASEARTGRFIKSWLEKNQEGAIIEMHQSYKQHIYRLNALRPKAKEIRTPTYESFLKYFGHLRRIGLVEWVRDEDFEMSGHEKLLSIRAGTVAKSSRRVYRLSAFGKMPESDILWDDPLFRGLMREVIIAQMGLMGGQPIPPKTD